MEGFEDHFSTSARSYARYRPGYPSALFDWLATLTADHGLAWDAGTGSGQAAVRLRRHYARVVATDASGEQLAMAPTVPGIEYRKEPAERTSLADGTVDLITGAASVHWFDHDRFHAEVRRVSKPGGAIAVWAYHLPRVLPAIDALVETYTDLLGPHWPPRARHVLERYRSLPFPFPEIDPPDFELTARWDLEEFLGFLGSWSAARAYREATGEDPLGRVAGRIEAEWGDPSAVREVSASLHLRVGRS